jgi:L-gulono-1,4-lactone dehydrogenase
MQSWAGLPVIAPAQQTNHSGNVSFTPAVAFQPSADINELSRILKAVHTTMPKGTKIKAGGSLHAYSDVAATSSVFLHPERMKGISRVPTSGSKMDVLRSDVLDEDRSNLFQVIAGTTIRELNETLWHDHRKALPNLGGYDGQTVAGVMATGTHGSVLSRGPMSSMIMATDLVRGDGAKVRIERHPGLSDPVRFRALYPDVELIQDNDVFAASLLHNGMLGVVHGHTLAVTDAFYLEEVRTMTDVDTTKALLGNGGAYRLLQTKTPERAGAGPMRPGFDGHPEKNFHLELWFNVHSDKVVVTTRNPVPLDEEPNNMSQRPGRDLVRAWRLGDTFTRPLLPTWISENMPQAVAWTNDMAAKMLPSAVPWMVDQTMAMLPDDSYTQRSYNVFNIGDGANAIPAIASTIFVPLRGDLHLRALDVFRDVAAQFAKDGKYQTGPLSLRFVGGSDALLASDEDVASFEIIFTQGTPHAAEMTEAYFRALRQVLGSDVRYHWGQHSPGLQPEDVIASCRSAEFADIQRRFDADGQFLNHTQERLFPR